MMSEDRLKLLEKKAAAMRRWRAQNLERARATLNAWRKRNPEKRRAQEARYRKKHHDKYVAKQKRSIAKLRANKPELIRKWNRNWYNKAKTTARYKERRKAERKRYVMRHASKVRDSKDRYARIAREKITPGYARQTLTAKSNLLACQIPDSMVQAQTINLRIKRYLWRSLMT
jgi:hypothetical protein